MGICGGVEGSGLGKPSSEGVVGVSGVEATGLVEEG